MTVCRRSVLDSISTCTCPCLSEISGVASVRALVFEVTPQDPKMSKRTTKAPKPPTREAQRPLRAHTHTQRTHTQRTYKQRSQGSAERIALQKRGGHWAKIGVEALLSE